MTKIVDSGWRNCGGKMTYSTVKLIGFCVVIFEAWPVHAILHLNNYSDQDVTALATDFLKAD